jgi:hypothetical protein
LPAFLALLALLLLHVGTIFGAAPPEQATEYQVKAAFLFNFAKFIDWPEKSFPDARSPFVICVVGRDPFGNALDGYLYGKTIGSRTVEIDRFATPGAMVVARRCQMAFISSSEQGRFRDVIASFQGQNTLLIGDADGFASCGGAIEFLIEQDHVRFAINPEAADRADLKVSSKLLALAEIIHDGSHDGLTSGRN